MLDTHWPLCRPKAQPCFIPSEQRKLRHGKLLRTGVVVVLKGGVGFVVGPGLGRRSRLNEATGHFSQERRE